MTEYTNKITEIILIKDINSNLTVYLKNFENIAECLHSCQQLSRGLFLYLLATITSKEKKLEIYLRSSDNTDRIVFVVN